MKEEEGSLRVTDQISGIVEPEAVSWPASGVISVARHIIGPQTQQLVKFLFGEGVDSATEIHMRYNPLSKDLFCSTNPIPRDIQSLLLRVEPKRGKEIFFFSWRWPRGPRWAGVVWRIFCVGAFGSRSGSGLELI